MVLIRALSSVEIRWRWASQKWMGTLSISRNNRPVSSPLYRTKVKFSLNIHMYIFMYASTFNHFSVIIYELSTAKEGDLLFNLIYQLRVETELRIRYVSFTSLSQFIKMLGNSAGQFGCKGIKECNRKI